MRILKLSFIGLLILLVCSSTGLAVHFLPVPPPTDVSMTVIFPRANVHLNTTGVVQGGDEMAAFTPAGYLAGICTWPDDGNIAMTLWGDSEYSEEIDGFVYNELIQWRYWSASQDLESTSFTVTYITGNNRFSPGATRTVANLNFVMPTPCAPPTLSSPLNGATCQATNVALTWLAASGAVSYNLQVATESTFASPVINQTGILGLTYTPAGLLNGTTYFWRVQTLCTSLSAWSAPWSYTTVNAAPAAPVLISPANGATGVGLSPTLSWEAVAGATNYDLQVSLFSDFSTTLVNVNQTALTYDLGGLANNTTYYWKVRANGACSTTGPWTQWSFTTMGIPIPEIPTLISPLDVASCVALDVTLVWDPAEGADTYNLQLATDNGFSNLIENETGLTATTYGPLGLDENDQYFWRVAAVNGGGTSDWSSVWSFTTTMYAGIVNLSFPANAAGNVAVDLTFEWDAAAGATDYHFMLATDEGFTNLVINESGLTGTTYPVTGLENGTTYFWKVRGVNYCDAGDWSDIWNFTTIVAGPEAPILVYPGDGAPDIPLTIDFDWNAAARADTYNIVVSLNADLSSPFIDVTGLTGTEYSAGGFAEGTTYYWAVEAVNAGGTAWSATWSFITMTTPPPDKILTLKLYMQGLFNGTFHQPYAVSVELRQGETLTGSTVVYRGAYILDANGEVTLNLTSFDNGFYWVVVRSGGYMPLAMPAGIDLDYGTITWDFTTGMDKAVGTDRALINIGDAWYMRAGDFNNSMNVNTLDLNMLLQSNGKSVVGEVPAP